MLKFLIILFISLQFNDTLFPQGTWIQKANFPGIPRYTAVGFSIGNKGYIGTGIDTAVVNTSDFWEWNQATNTWSQKANFPGTPRCHAVGFSIGNKGYIGTGGTTITSSNGPFYSDFWEYDPSVNSWTQKTNFGSSARFRATGFSIGTKGYIGTGWDGNYKKDFWEWDQGTNTWTQKANFGGNQRWHDIGFSIGTKGYIGLGYYNASLQDFWEWDQATNVWTQKANFGGVARSSTVGFSIGTKGYVGTGYNLTLYEQQDFWEWDQATNTWTQKTNYPPGKSSAGIGLSIGNCGYIGIGSVNSSYYQGFWEFCPNSSCCNVMSLTSTSQNILCNSQCTGTATANPTNGISPYTYNWSNGQTTQTSIGLCAGTYSVMVTDASSATTSAIVTITQPSPLSASASSNPATCLNNNGSATISVNGGTPGYSYNWNPSAQTTQTATGLMAGNYSVMITDAYGCTKLQTITVASSSSLTINTSSTQTGCVKNNGTALATPSNGNAPYTYNWNNGQTSQTATGLGAGIYSVTVTDANGCSQSQAISVATAPGPTVNVSTATSSISLGDSVQLNATGGGLYQWSPSAGLNCTTCANPTAAPEQTTTYCVLVTDSGGCTTNACVTIEIRCGNIFIPNAFSPNNDNENELECVLGNCIQTLYVAIYNRWGEKVFETIDQKTCWNGKYNGKDENASVFTYYLEATLTNGTRINRKGNISLLR